MLATFNNAVALISGVFLLFLNGFLVGYVGVKSVMSFVGILVGAFSLLCSVWARFDREFGFTASIAADGVHIKRGLTARRHVTIPPGRIHALEVTQPLIWRIFGWYRVEITQAGNAKTTNDESNNKDRMQVDVASDVLLPVGNRADLLRAIAIAIPDLGVDDPDGFLTSLRAGTREDRWMTPIPPSARILDPIVYSRRAFSVTDAVFAIRDGFFNLRFSIIPLTHIQSVSLHQGPIQRWRRVATVRAELVPGRVASTAEHVGDGRSLRLCTQLSEGSKIRREAEAPERWLSRVTEIVEATSRPTASGE
jgi:putative bacterial membrane flanked domain protein